MLLVAGSVNEEATEVSGDISATISSGLTSFLLVEAALACFLFLHAAAFLGSSMVVNA